MDKTLEWLMAKPYCANPLKINIWYEQSGFPALLNYPVAIDKQLPRRTKSATQAEGSR